MLSQGLYDAILAGDAKNAEAAVHEALAAGVNPAMLIADTMIPAMDAVGKLFEEEEYFVPELLLAGRAMKAAMEPSLKQNHDIWKGYATTSQGKENLKTTCKASTDALAAGCK